MVSDFIAAIPFGGLLGLVFGPLRLAGVDYSKWYRDPGEVSESGDRSWIGLMKRTALHFGNRLLLIVLAVALGVPLLRCLSTWIAGKFGAVPTFDEHAFYLLRFAQWWYWPRLLGFLVGIAAAQAFVEIIWRLGLRRGTGRFVQIRLARRRRATQVAPAQPRPPQPGRRRLIICCDGTWNSPLQARETNVVHLLRAIKPVGTAEDETPISQLVHYHLGVGTGNILDRWLGGGAGVGLSSSVKACYGFLVDNYVDGDEILLFGFSRGAYVVRSVSGMLGAVGLLRKHEMFRFIEAWDYYASPEAQRNATALDQVAPQRIRHVEIKCLAVWDTVGALGIPGTRLCASTFAFHQTKLGTHVRNAFQALALDERRGNFQPAIWVKNPDAPNQVLEQVWFPGVHSNIGGGYQEHGLSDAALLWMMHKVHALLDIDETSIDLAGCMPLTKRAIG